MSTPAVEITGLGFHYPGRAPLITGLSLTIDAGARFGLFGPNGAGKTTLMNLMTGVLTAEQGAIRLFGEKAGNNTRFLFGFVPQDFSFYAELSPVQNLAFFGAWAGLDRAETRRRTTELLEILGLLDPRCLCTVAMYGDDNRHYMVRVVTEWSVHQPQEAFARRSGCGE